MADVDPLRPTPSYPVRPVREHDENRRQPPGSGSKTPERKPAEKPRDQDDSSRIDEYA